MQPDSSLTQSDHQNHSQCYKAWIEDGILFHKYQDELTLPVVLEAERKSLALLSSSGSRILPIIVFLQNIDKDRYKLTMADYGRVLSTFDLAKHASGVWIVGVADEVKQTIITIGNYFLVNRIFFADNLEEAKKAAKSFTFSSHSILDRE